MEIRQTRSEDQGYITDRVNKLLSYHQVLDAFYRPIAEGRLDDVGTREPFSYVAESESGLVGYVSGVLVVNAPDRSCTFAILQNVWVDEVYRHQGIAKELVQAFEEEAKLRGAKQIDIHVDVRNTAGMEFWAAAGYETYQERRRKNIAE